MSDFGAFFLGCGIAFLIAFTIVLLSAVLFNREVVSIVVGFVVFLIVAPVLVLVFQTIPTSAEKYGGSCYYVIGTDGYSPSGTVTDLGGIDAVVIDCPADTGPREV